MPKANKKNLMLNQPTNHGGWPSGEYDPPVQDQLTDWYRDMELIEEKKLREVIRNEINNILGSRLDECIIVAGSTDDGNHILAKSRDRNYRPDIIINRKISDDGTEMVYIQDIKTNYVEGMNEKGIGVVNSALLVGDDEEAVKGMKKSHDGNVMLKAISKGSLSDCLKTLVSYRDGIRGHTFIGSPNNLYSLEMTSKHNPIINKLDPTTGFDIRTNHGVKHSSAGYTPDRYPDDYLSSKIRLATADVELSNIEGFDDVAPALVNQQFDKGSNYNMLRRTAKMRTSSQVAMDLANKVFTFYYFPNECNYLGIQDDTPDEYEPKIDIQVKKYT